MNKDNFVNITFFTKKSKKVGLMKATIDFKQKLADRQDLAEYTANAMELFETRNPQVTLEKKEEKYQTTAVSNLVLYLRGDDLLESRKKKYLRQELIYAFKYFEPTNFKAITKEVEPVLAQGPALDFTKEELQTWIMEAAPKSDPEQLQQLIDDSFKRQLEQISQEVFDFQAGTENIKKELRSFLNNELQSNQDFFMERFLKANEPKASINELRPAIQEVIQSELPKANRHFLEEIKTVVTKSVAREDLRVELQEAVSQSAAAVEDRLVQTVAQIKTEQVSAAHFAAFAEKVEGQLAAQQLAQAVTKLRAQQQLLDERMQAVQALLEREQPAVVTEVAAEVSVVTEAPAAVVLDPVSEEPAIEEAAEALPIVSEVEPVEVEVPEEQVAPTAAVPLAAEPTVVLKAKETETSVDEEIVAETTAETLMAEAAQEPVIAAVDEAVEVVEAVEAETSGAEVAEAAADASEPLVEEPKVGPAEGMYDEQVVEDLETELALEEQAAQAEQLEAELIVAQQQQALEEIVVAAAEPAVPEAVAAEVAEVVEEEVLMDTAVVAKPVVEAVAAPAETTAPTDVFAGFMPTMAEEDQPLQLLYEETAAGFFDAEREKSLFRKTITVQEYRTYLNSAEVCEFRWQSLANLSSEAFGKYHLDDFQTEMDQLNGFIDEITAKSKKGLSEAKVKIPKQLLTKLRAYDRLSELLFAVLQKYEEA